jgi:hypothetical protein
MIPQVLRRFFLCMVDGKVKGANTFCLSKNENGLKASNLWKLLCYMICANSNLLDQFARHFSVFNCIGCL